MKKVTFSFCACLIIISCAKNKSMQPDLSAYKQSGPINDSLNDSIVNPFDSLPILTFDTSSVILPGGWANDSISTGDSTMLRIQRKH